jgi:pimeloyl-ACP methyl ester carboxylesterase
MMVTEGWDRMVAQQQPWSEEVIRVAGTDLSCIKGGRGRPLLVLHEELGHPGWLHWHARLSRRRMLYIPLHPGFGVSPRLDWIMHMRDLACFYARVLRELELVPIDVIGFSFGGWLAAEMAANCAEQFGRMILVAAVGIRPPAGEILDMFRVTARTYLNASVYDRMHTPEFATLYGGSASPEQFEAWEDARTETARLAWQPYMHNPSLGHLLEGIRNLPTLLIWGRQDAVVPLSAGQAYQQAIAGSELVLLEACGHRPEIEQTAKFVHAVERFLAEGGQ